MPDRLPARLRTPQGERELSEDEARDLLACALGSSDPAGEAVDVREENGRTVYVLRPEGAPSPRPRSTACWSEWAPSPPGTCAEPLMAEELAPCPFCGGPVEWWVGGEQTLICTGGCRWFFKAWPDENGPGSWNALHALRLQREQATIPETAFERLRAATVEEDRELLERLAGDA